MDGLQVLRQWVGESRSMVFFGGAGVSTESGIPDFRSVDGLYRMEYKYPPETIVSNDFFFSHTEDFFEFYRKKLMALDAKPNPAHRALARLEELGTLRAVVTQNIDGLHQAAGSRQVYELHGSIHRNYCLSCGKFYTAREVYESTGVPRCTCGGVIKPDVVLYGESLDARTVSGAVQAIRQADLLLVGGTSLSVYPAAGLIQEYRGGRLVLINRDPTPYDRQANLLLTGKIGEILSCLQL